MTNVYTAKYLVHMLPLWTIIFQQLLNHYCIIWYLSGCIWIWWIITAKGIIWYFSVRVGLRFHLLLTTPLWCKWPTPCAFKAVSRTCTIIQIKYICRNCVTCPSIPTDSVTWSPEYSASPCAWMVGAEICTGNTPWLPIINLNNMELLRGK